MAFIPRFNDNKLNIDYSHCQEVAVITNFAPSGKFKPLYFSVKDKYGNDCNVKITDIKDTKEENGYTTFCCSYQVGSVQRLCFLTYYIIEHLWVLKN